MTKIDYQDFQDCAEDIIDDFGENLVFIDPLGVTLKGVGVFIEPLKKDAENIGEASMNLLISPTKKVLKDPPVPGDYVDRGSGKTFQRWIIEEIGEVRPAGIVLMWKASVNNLVHEITIQSVTMTQNANYDYTATYATLATVFADIKFDEGEEEVKGEQLDNPVTFIFTIQHRTDVLSEQRILLDSEYYKIESVYDKIGTRKFLTIKATKIEQGESATL